MAKVIGKWFYSTEDTRGKKIWCVKRGVVTNGKRNYERYSREKYKDILIEDEQGIKDFVLRLNGRDKQEEEAKKVFELENAFVNKKILREFQEHLITQSPTEKEAIKAYNAFFTHFILLIYKLKIIDPNDWQKNESKIGHEMLKSGLSRNHLRRVIQATRKFIKYIHYLYPKEIIFFIFNPISKAQFKKTEADRSLLLKNGKKYISEKDFKAIVANSPEKLKPIILLCRKYGFRPSECLGLIEGLSYVKKGYILVERALERFTDGQLFFVPTKSRKSRKVPHYYLSAEEAHGLISEISPMHPTTLSHLFADYIDYLLSKKWITQKYILKDLRNTYITDVVQEYGIYEAQQAAGHSDLKTTSGYVRDKRNLDDEDFVA